MDNFLKILYIGIVSVVLCLCMIFLGNHFIENYTKSMSTISDTKPLPIVIADNSVQDVDKKEYECVVQALFHEARGEGEEGILAVASVIYNRVKSRSYPNSFCGVIHQPKQFSYVHERLNAGLTLDAKPKASEIEVFEFIKQTAQKVVTNEFEPVVPHGTLWYAHQRINNYWTKTKVKVAHIGNHVFYVKPQKKGNS